MICLKFTAFCDLGADLRIGLATLRKSVRKFWFCKLASPFGQGLIKHILLKREWL